MENVFYYGIVEDRNDPQMQNRVRVRVFGIHPENKKYVATPDLPWAQVLMPTTSATLSGFGMQHGLVEGSHVTVIFRDPHTKQDPVVIGTVAGVNLPKFVEKVIDRKTNKGFNDPRLLKAEDYALSETKFEEKYGKKYTQVMDSFAPLEADAVRPGLLASIEKSPVIPEKLEIDYTKKGKSKITNPTITFEDLPYYPLADYYSKTDLSKYAKGEADYSVLLDGPTKASGEYLGPHPKTKAKPEYPYNKSWLTESGHLFELDDTRDKERILLYHRSGSFTEIQPDGDRHTRIVNDDYEVVCGNKEITVCGNVKIVVKGDADINVSGKIDMTAGSDIKITSNTIKLN